MTIDLTQVIVALIGLLAAIVTTVAVPLIKAKVGAAQWETIVMWAQAGVQAAEVLFQGVGLGDEKRSYVLEFIKNQCDQKGIRFDETAARIALEDAWKLLIGEAEGLPLKEYASSEELSGETGRQI